MTRPAVRVRVELWDDLPAAGGVRVGFVPARDLLRVTTPDAVDYTQRAEIECVASAEVLAALGILTRGVGQTQPVARLVPLADDGTTVAAAPAESWRLLTDTLALGPGQRTLTLTGEHPLLDWGAVGRLRSTSGAGLHTFDLSGVYTPGEVVTLCCDWLAAQGRGWWRPGTMGRTDRKSVSLANTTPLEALHRVAELWALELAPRVAANELTHYLDLPERAGAGAAVPVLRLGGALHSVTRTRDATDQAHAVLAIGADGVTIGSGGGCPWRVTAAETVTDWIDCVDPAGGPGPVQIDGQLAGAYVQRMGGTRTAIVDSLRGDGTTSRIRVVDAAGVAAGDVIEVRADAAGTRMLTLDDPAVAAAARVEVALERGDLGAGRNYAPNPRGADYGSPTAAPTGYTSTANAIQRVTSGYPVGNPVGDPGYSWRVTFTGSGQYYDGPLCPAIDPVLGDNQVAWGITVYVDGDLSDYHNGAPNTLGDDTVTRPKPRVTLIAPGGAIAAGDLAAELHIQRGDATSGRRWIALGRAGLTLQALAQLRLRLDFVDGRTPVAGTSGYVVTPFPPGGYNVFVAAEQLTRGAELEPYSDTPRLTTLWQAANAHLLAHRGRVTALEATAEDRAALNPDAYGDQPLVPGGDVVLRDAETGLDERARYVGRRRERLTRGPSSLQLVAAPDPTVAALLAAAAPTRPESLTEIVRREVAAARAGAGSAAAAPVGGGGGGGGGGGSTAPTIIGGLLRVDPEYYGADPTGATDETTRLQSILDTYGELRVRRGATFTTRRLLKSGTQSVSPSEGVRIWGGGTLKLKAGQNTELLWLDGVTWSILEDVVLDGNKAAQTPGSAVTLLLRNMAYTRVSGVRVLNSAAHGIAVENYDTVSASGMADEINFTDVFVLFATNDGMRIRAVNPAGQAPGDLTLQGVHLNANGGNGLRSDGSFFNKIIGGEFLTNAGAGLVLTYGAGVVVQGGTSRNNGSHGLWMQNTLDTLVSGFTSHFNNLNATTGVGILAEYCDDLLVVGSKVHDTAFTTRTYRPLKATNCGRLALRSSRFAVGTAGASGADIYGTGGLHLDATTAATYSARDNLGISDT